MQPDHIALKICKNGRNNDDNDDDDQNLTKEEREKRESLFKKILNGTLEICSLDFSGKDDNSFKAKNNKLSYNDKHNVTIEKSNVISRQLLI